MILSSMQTEELFVQMMNIGIVVGVTIALVVVLVYYIFEALGLYGLSKNRGYQKPWLAFIPVVNGYLLGNIADNVNYCYGKKTSFRIWMLVARIFSAVNAILMWIFLTLGLWEMIQGILYNPESFLYSSSYLQMIAISSVSGLIGLGIMVLRAFILYKIYQDYTPNGMIYTVLSVLIPLFTGIDLAAFLLFSLRKKPAASLQIRPAAAPPYPPVV